MHEPRTLGEFPYRRVRVSCVWCPRRRGEYDTERMVARLGAGASLEEVLLLVTRSGPRPKGWLVRGRRSTCPGAGPSSTTSGTGARRTVVGLKSTTWYSSTRSVEGGERALASVPEAVVRAMAIFISLWQGGRLVTAPLPR